MDGTVKNRVDALLNDFALRSFRDIADDDYVAARMASRAQLVVQFLWSSQQAIEKYIKCILLLNRIAAAKILHDLDKGLSKIKTSGKLTLTLTKGTEDFIHYLDEFGKWRYLELSNRAFAFELVHLDRSVWELRRYCTLALQPRQAVLRDGYPAPKIHLSGGRLEEIINSPKDPARAALLWQNAFFGYRIRRRVKLPEWFKATNAPLFWNPDILDEVLKYVYLPGSVVDGYRTHKKPA